MKSQILGVPGHTLVLARRGWRYVRMLALRPLFGSHGRNFRFDPDGWYSYPNIHVGDDVSLNGRPTLMAALSEIHIGNKVMFGPNVTVIGGGHNTGVVGRFMTDVLEKSGNEDLGVVIEDDVWVGSNATLLRGVRVGRGSVVSAAAVVTRSVPPYSIVGGNPARVIRFRWAVDTILVHEQALYPPEERFGRADLERLQSEASMLPPTRSQA